MRAKAAGAVSKKDICGLLREHLKACGYVQTGYESLAESMARAFGINCQDLRHLLAWPAEDFKAKLLSL
jgi:hypothetical protein